MSAQVMTGLLPSWEEFLALNPGPAITSILDSETVEGISFTFSLSLQQTFIKISVLTSAQYLWGDLRTMCSIRCDFAYIWKDHSDNDTKMNESRVRPISILLELSRRDLRRAEPHQ